MSITPLQQIPVVQMGHVEKIVEAVQNQPEVQQAVAQETAKSRLKAQEDQVPRVEKDREAEKLRTNEDGRNKQNPGREPVKKDQRKAGANQPAPATEETPARGDNPFAGHIVNLKV